MQAIGIFGGTFDPIHYGHLRLAEEMAEALNLREVRFIPAGRPPHRDTPRTEAHHRLEMVRRAVAGNPRFCVDEREIRAARPNYTVDTLIGLRSELGAQQPLCLLLGADAFLDLPSWHEWQRLFDLTHIVVAQRPGSRVMDAMPDALQREVQSRWASGNSIAGVVPAIASAIFDDASLERSTPPDARPSAGFGTAGTVRLLDMTPLAISATVLRQALARRHSVRYLLPDAVLDYIQQHQLYKPQPA